MKIRWLAVIRDVLVIILLTSVGGFLVGILGVQQTRTRTYLAAANIFFSVVGFTISGCMAKVDKSRHLFTVAIALWIVTITNVFLGAPFISWLLGILPILLMMAIGNALSSFFVRTPEKREIKEEDKEPSP